MVENKENQVPVELWSKYDIPAKQDFEFSEHLNLDNPELWSIASPSMYILKSVIYINDNIIDTYETPFGIRKIKFTADKGFFLNDERVKINGVCIHHDGGSVGAAVPERVLERRLQLLKTMGCNAIRTSHNPPSSEMLDMCDRMGFLVMDEAFDEWKITKAKNGNSKYGYSKYFDAFAVQDLRNMLNRDRNHPSIILSSVGNEILDQTKEEGAIILEKLLSICHSMDSTRPVTSACDNIVAEPVETTSAVLEQLDVIGYNYVDRWRTRTETFYADDHYLHPHWKVIGSENVSASGVRGQYQMEADALIWWKGPYFSSMLTAERLWKFTKMHDYVAGDFMWTGIDYLGESRWPNKNASSGMFYTCCFPKDGFYFYQSQWTEKSMLHVFPHWNWKGLEGKIIPVICYTNCESAELFLNGKFFGVKSYEFPRQGMTEVFPHFERKIIQATTSDLHLS
ncbi:MAG TPA: glycoside hydrolase family 2 TIM barrel-domain containing protein [Ruminiclostridium sp.]